MASGKGGIIVTGGAAALLTLGAWDKSSEILEKLGVVSAQQSVMSVTVSALKEQVTTQLARNEQSLAANTAFDQAMDQRLRLVETTLATMGTKK